MYVQFDVFDGMFGFGWMVDSSDVFDGVSGLWGMGWGSCGLVSLAATRMTSLTVLVGWSVFGCFVRGLWSIVRDDIVV